MNPNTKNVKNTIKISNIIWFLLIMILNYEVYSLNVRYGPSNSLQVEYFNE